MINQISVPYNQINIPVDEVIRYLGYGSANPDKEVMLLVDKVIAEIHPRLGCKACYCRYPIIKNSDGSLTIGLINTDSVNLIKNLSHCEEAIVFTATIGYDTDRIIQKYAAISPSNAVVAQAVGAAATEQWCDILCSKFADEELKNNKYIQTRFSPGYGDFSLDHQKDILLMLDTSRKIGVSLTDGLLMLPGKSVSALVGISDYNLNCTAAGCEACSKSDCQYKRS